MDKKHVPLCASCGMELTGKPTKKSLCPECEKKIQCGQVPWPKPKQESTLHVNFLGGE